MRAAGLLFLFIIGTLLIMNSQHEQKEFSQMIVNGYRVSLEVARSLEEKRKGLSDRDSLFEDAGMLFLFETPAIRSFWMKDMKFAIDILWIDEQGIIVGMEENISSDSFPQRFRSPKPVPYVVEVSAGWAASHSVKVGDKTRFQESD